MQGIKVLISILNYMGYLYWIKVYFAPVRIATADKILKQYFQYDIIRPKANELFLI